MQKIKIILFFVHMNCDCDSTIDSTIDYTYGKQHYEGPLLSSSQNPQYSSIKCKAFTLIQNNHKVLIGRKFLKLNNLFEIPCKSSLLDIYIVEKLSQPLFWPIKEIQHKNCLLAIRGKCGSFASIPLMHSDI
ncbi:Uncharacterized protein FWK35_00004945 [Aphis craccivora]|uniref:Uncharacterized protein n=1 Tax=Aphis craccivora TaxID=307492 RepID=A0A6G0ZF57_APHCR|nr:Uncharacterized protein FWK35_00004945 [Aphis craccivora]